jgi:hypothetical protein
MMHGQQNIKFIWESISQFIKEWKRESYQKKFWNGVHQEEENKEDLY